MPDIRGDYTIGYELYSASSDCVLTARPMLMPNFEGLDRRSFLEWARATFRPRLGHI